MKTVEMIKAKITDGRNIEVYIHDGVKPSASYNHGKLVVSKQPNSSATFSVNEGDLELT